MTSDRPGLQPERTELAWRRSAVVLMVGATVLCATAVRVQSYVMATAGAVVAVVAAWWALRYQATRDEAGIWAALVRIVVLCVVLGCLGAIAALAHVFR